MRFPAAFVVAFLAPLSQVPAQQPAAPAPVSSDRVLEALAVVRAASSPAPASESDAGAGEDAASTPLESTCPRAALAALFAASTDADGIGPALALERETLTLCKERAQLAVDILQLEEKLRQAAAAGDGTSDTAPSLAAAPVLDSGQFAAQLDVQTDAEPPAESPAAPAPPVTPEEAEAAPAPAPAPVEEAAAPVERQDFAWFSIIGTAGRLRAGISDGEGVWFVAEGDSVGESTIERIRSQPPAVLLTDGRELPWVGSLPRGGQ